MVSISLLLLCKSYYEIKRDECEAEATHSNFIIGDWLMAAMAWLPSTETLVACFMKKIQWMLVSTLTAPTAIGYVACFFHNAFGVYTKLTYFTKWIDISAVVTIERPGNYWTVSNNKKSWCHKYLLLVARLVQKTDKNESWIEKFRLKTACLKLLTEIRKVIVNVLVGVPLGLFL